MSNSLLGFIVGTVAVVIGMVTLILTDPVIAAGTVILLWGNNLQQGYLDVAPKVGK